MVNWIAGATKNAHGQFRAKAQRAGKSTRAFANQVIANPGKYDSKTVQQAHLARTLMDMKK